MGICRALSHGDRGTGLANTQSMSESPNLPRPRVIQLRALFAHPLIWALLALLSMCGMDGAGAITDGVFLVPSRFPQIVEISQYVRATRCTASLVGPRILLTAKHCFDGDRLDKPHDVRVGARAYRSARILLPVADPDPDSTLDLALMVLDRAVVGVPPLSIGRGPQLRDRVLALGYGCVYAQGLGASVGSGVLRAQVAQVRTDPVFARDQYFLLVGASPGSEQPLCAGDSGGPSLAYSTLDGSVAVVGVHAQTGHDARIDTPAALGYLDEAGRWDGATRGTSICGVHAECAPVRYEGAAMQRLAAALGG